MPERSVLIDTWWNVNIKFVTHCAAAFTVLIDTWWNVNYVSFLLYLPRCGCFNRYMVECECFNFTHSISKKTVLIDTWWNVNEDSY